MLDEELYEEDVFGTPVPKGSDSTGSSRDDAALWASTPGNAPSWDWPDGVWPGAAGTGPGAAGSVDVSAEMAALQKAARAIAAQVPSGLAEPVALAEAKALLAVVEQLRGAALTRIADVDARKLHLLDGAGSTTSWVEAQQTSLDRGEVALARRLGSFTTLDEAVQSGGLSIAVAERVGKALAKLRRHVDRPDGLIDGQDGEQALVGVIGHGVRQQVLEALGGLDEVDPRLVELIEALAHIVERPVSQLARLEAAFVLLAQHLEPHQLPGSLGLLVDALLPNELEKKADDAHRNRGFGIRLKDDGSGWRVTEGDLDLECGELLSAVLQAELAVDPDGPVDTEAFARLRADGWQDGDPVPESGPAPGGPAPGSPAPDGAGAQAPDGQLLGPRSLRQKRHDALRNGLRRYLDSGIAGLRDKVAPHLGVTVGVDQLQDQIEQQPGALPAVSTVTGARLPASLVRRWLCDSAVTRFVLSLGGRVIETSHTERTLKPHERRILKIETGGRCAAAGCRCGPGSNARGTGRLVPHHPDAYARSGTTSLRDAVPLCDRHHHDVHHGTTLRLRDGRWLHESGWVTGPQQRAGRAA